MKFTFKISLVLLVLLGITTVAHALVLPQPTRCLLIDFYDFEKDGNLYYRDGLSKEKKEEIKSLIKQASQRVDTFWKGKTVNPAFIYCESDEDYLKFGAPFMTPAAAIMSFKSYVVISKDGINLDILSHEISHTELGERVGMLNRALKIPTWFDEGLAMQVDHRDYYSLETLRKESNNFTNLPDVKKLTNGALFGGGNREQVMLNYKTAKYEIHNWYTPEKLTAFIEKLNDGASFEEAYSF